MTMSHEHDEKENQKPPVKLMALPPKPPQPGSKWFHWKGHIVTVLGTGHHSETGEPVVLYTYQGKFWARPMALWWDDARPGIQRFTLQAAAATGSA